MADIHQGSREKTSFCPFNFEQILSGKELPEPCNMRELSLTKDDFMHWIAVMESVIPSIDRHQKWKKEFLLYINSMHFVICKQDMEKNLGKLSNVLTGNALPKLARKILAQVAIDIR